MDARILNMPQLPASKRLCKPEVEYFSFEDGTRLAFDVNSLCLVHVSKAIADNLPAYEAPKFFAGLLYSRTAPDFKLYPETPLRRLVLNVTHACNLACEYCFAAKYETGKNMPVETALEALNRFDESASIDIAFFGGEPMLAFDVVMSVAERAHLRAAERKVGCKLHMTTNATKIGDIQAVALKRYGFSVLVSLDGPEDMHNAARPARKGNSWQQTMNGIAALNKAGIRPFTRATFTGDARLVERLEFFAELFDSGKISGVSIEPAILSEGCRTAGEVTPLAIDWHSAAKWYVERIRAKRDFPYFYFHKLIQRIYRGMPHGTECGAGKGYLTVGPDGTIFACHREEGAEIGSLESGFDEARRGPWLNNLVTHHPDCGKCWARYLCGGGCPQARASLGGSPEAEMPAVCEVKREMLKEVFWIMSQLTDEEIRRIAEPQKKHQCKRTA